MLSQTRPGGRGRKAAEESVEGGFRVSASKRMPQKRKNERVRGMEGERRIEEKEEEKEEGEQASSGAERTASFLHGSMSFSFVILEKSTHGPAFALVRID